MSWQEASAGDPAGLSEEESGNDMHVDDWDYDEDESSDESQEECKGFKAAECLLGTLLETESKSNSSHHQEGRSHNRREVLRSLCRMVRSLL